jgi:uncharacterized membrane protein YfcA
VDFIRALPVAVGSVVAQRAGASLAVKSQGSTARKIYALLLVVVGIDMFFF